MPDRAMSLAQFTHALADSGEVSEGLIIFAPPQPQPAAVTEGEEAEC